MLSRSWNTSSAILFVAIATHLVNFQKKSVFDKIGEKRIMVSS